MHWLLLLLPRGCDVAVAFVTVMGESGCELSFEENLRGAPVGERFTRTRGGSSSRSGVVALWTRWHSRSCRDWERCGRRGLGLGGVTTGQLGRARVLRGCKSHMLPRACNNTTARHARAISSASARAILPASQRVLRRCCWPPAVPARRVRRPPHRVGLWPAAAPGSSLPVQPRVACRCVSPNTAARGCRCGSPAWHHNCTARTGAHASSSSLPSSRSCQRCTSRPLRAEAMRPHRPSRGSCAGTQV